MVTVSLITLDVQFGSVPAGRTVIKPIYISVTGGGSVDFSAQTSPGFKVMPKSRFGGAGPVETVWVKYTAPVPPGPTLDGSIDLSVLGGSAIGTVTLHATPVAQQSKSVSVVLDRSGSMGTPSGAGGTRMAALQLAVPQLITLVPDFYSLGVVQFSTTAQELRPMLPASGPNKAAAEGAIMGLQPGGATSIGAGVQVAATQLSGTLQPSTIVFTDGEENTAPFIADVAGLITGSVYAVGLGTAAQLNPGALLELCNNHNNGYLIVTGSAVIESDDFELEKYFLQILANLMNDQIIVDPSRMLTPGAEWELRFDVTELDSSFKVVVLSTAPDELEVDLVTPADEIIPWETSLSGVDWGRTRRMKYVIVEVPAKDLSDTHQGTWRVQVRRRDADRARDEIPVDISVYTASAIGLSLWAQQDQTVPGAEVKVKAILAIDSEPWAFDASLLLVVHSPGGITFRPSLVESVPGVFDGTFVADIPGTYKIEVSVAGMMDDLLDPNSGSEPAKFTRFATRSVSVWSPVDRPRRIPGEDVDAKPGRALGTHITSWWSRFIQRR